MSSRRLVTQQNSSSSSFLHMRIKERKDSIDASFNYCLSFSIIHSRFRDTSRQSMLPNLQKHILTSQMERVDCSACPRFVSRITRIPRQNMVVIGKRRQQTCADRDLSCANTLVRAYSTGTLSGMKISDISRGALGTRCAIHHRHATAIRG